MTVSRGISPSATKMRMRQNGFDFYQSSALTTSTDINIDTGNSHEELFEVFGFNNLDGRFGAQELSCGLDIFLFLPGA
jgi:hypothetical protein